MLKEYGNFWYSYKERTVGREKCVVYHGEIKESIMNDGTDKNSRVFQLQQKKDIYIFSCWSYAWTIETARMTAKQTH